MKILYLSCHSILEFEEVSLLHELGHEVFSPGAYVEPANPGDASLRPAIPGLLYNTDILQKFHAIHNKFPGQDNKDHLTHEVVDYFDTIIIMHLPRWIQLNWNVFQNKRVIWRTIGQSISNVEHALKPYRKRGLQVVRYSPMERNIPSYIGEDAIIRFYKDPEQYENWNGNKERVINFSQHMQQRNRACNFTFFEEVTRPFNRHLFGPGNESAGDWATGKVSYERLQKELRDNRVYFYTGTHPASYTLNFMEAWMTGIPIVAIGSKYGNADYFTDHNLYEVPNLIQNGIDGFVSDDPKVLQTWIRELFQDKKLAISVSKKGRKSAIEFFGKEKIKQQWKDFLNE